MTDKNGKDTEKNGKDTEKKPLTLSKKTLTLNKEGGAPKVRQSFTHGRSKTVTVEVKKKRVVLPGQGGSEGQAKGSGSSTTGLTSQEIQDRLKAIHGAMNTKAAESEKKRAEAQRELEEAQKQAEAEEEAAAKAKTEEESRETIEQPENVPPPSPTAPSHHRKKTTYSAYNEEEDESSKKGRGEGKLKIPAVKRTEPRRDSGKLTISQALRGDEERRTRSLASIRRQREKRKMMGEEKPQQKVIRDVVIPEFITVQELSNRLAERSSDVIKALMKMGVMATITQSIDGDTAELIATEFGHKVKRVSESDIEIGLRLDDADDKKALQPRPPVVTVMGHVDHGKTSLLDALRKTDVVAGEAGGITQHIGAYQVTLPSNQKITFIDTPGHAAFTEMRARGANVTDIVVLVVAADDGVKDQTVEAIRHAKAANVPIIIAINKIDKPDANPENVRNMLMQHEIYLEKVGGDILDVEVSAKKGTNLDKLEETILLQAELLELKANPERIAEGVVIESKLERGRGVVATILVQKGTLKVGDIFVAGAEFGRVRALIDDRGQQIQSAGPSMPVEVLGFNGAPMAGDEFIVIESETRAREISDFRQRQAREAKSVLSARGSMEQMFSEIAAGEVRELPVVIKSDVQGSMEAICGSLTKLSTDEVKVNILHSAVGEITESDVTLAKASDAIIIGFNVRANPQAREVARRDNVDIRYYSIIYDVIDDMKAGLGGLLAPTLREKYLGKAEIRTVFSVSKVGKIAGCMVTEGLVKRGSKVRLLRDNIVIHEGMLKTLKRFKDEVKEVKEGYECGMAFENYNDIKEGDVIECFEIEEISRSLD